MFLARLLTDLEPSGPLRPVASQIVLENARPETKTDAKRKGMMVVQGQPVVAVALTTES